MKTRFFALAALVLSLAACTQDEVGFLPEGAEGTPIVFTATGLNPVATATAGTRAPADGNWEGVQSVAVLMDGTVKTYNVTPSTADPTSATLTSTAPHYWTSHNDITVTAWWPYTAGETTPPAVKVKANQSTQKDFEGSDLIVAGGQTVTYGSPTLRFTHRTARVTIVLTDYTEGLASVQLTGLSTEGGNPDIIVPYDKGSNTYTAIVAPQSVAAGTAFITCTFTNGKTFVYKMKNATDWQAGGEYTYTVSLATARGYIIEDDGSYTVYNADGLLAWNKAIQKDESINCTLTADIDLTGREWTRLDTWPGYSGVFNGQGHSITGLNFSATRFGLFLFLQYSGVIKNLQLIDVNLDGSSGGAAGMVDRNHGQIIACSVTGKLTVHSGGIANANYGDIIACWFNGTLKDEAGCGTIVRFNYKNITSCYWGGNTGQGVLRNEGGKEDATKVDGATVKWQTAVDGMNTALTDNDYQWALGTDGLPVLQKKQ